MVSTNKDKQPTGKWQMSALLQDSIHTADGGGDGSGADRDADRTAGDLAGAMRAVDPGHAMGVLGDSGVAHDDLRDSSRESSGRFEPPRGVMPSSTFAGTMVGSQLAGPQPTFQSGPGLSVTPVTPSSNSRSTSGTGESHESEQRRSLLDHSQAHVRSAPEFTRGPQPNGWMNRSRFRPYFNISLVGDSKVASCVYCGKEYKEGESTGNLSKHITNNHAVEYKSRERAASKESTLTSLTSKERSLRLSSRFVAELNRDSGTFASVVLITETLVPFYVVESMGWKIINGLVPDVPLIETRKAVVEKLDHYSKSLNHSLYNSLEASTFLSVQLYVCSRENGLRYLAVSVSFAPNILDQERLANIHSPELLLNNTGDPVNGHLLDVVEFNDQSPEHSALYKGVLKILDDYNIRHKVAMVTIDQFSHALGLHDALMSELLSDTSSEVMRYLGNVRLSRCINSGLELQFDCIGNDLIKDGDFQHEFQKIEKLAQSWENIPFLKNFADELGRPPYLSSQHNKTRGVWRRVTRFLRVHQRLKDWTNTPENELEASTVNAVGENISHTSRALEMFRYFVNCCSVFDKLRGSMLSDGICFLTEGIFIYYKLNRFFFFCEEAYQGKTIHDEEFSYLNGAENLLPEHKQRILKAVLTSRSMFDGFFEGVRNNSLFYVAAALDPSSKIESFHGLASDDELNMLICQVEVTIQDYLARCSSSDHQRSQGATQGGIKRKKTDQDTSRPTLPPLTPRAQDEWVLYKAEAKLSTKSRREVIQWWYDRRASYPHLFRLAMALYYMQISSNETENIFYVTEHTLKVYQRSVGRANTQKVMLLRNRFKNFGLYNQALRFVNPTVD
ncbi:putative transposase of the Rover hAT-like DNA transposon [Lachancea thermotolerans]